MTVLICAGSGEDTAFLMAYTCPKTGPRWGIRHKSKQQIVGTKISSAMIIKTGSCWH